MPNKTPYKERLRKKIQTAMVLDRLIKGFEGEIELTSVQANIGIKLLNKMLPDLKATEANITGDINQTHSVDEQSVEQAVEVLRAKLDELRA